MSRHVSMYENGHTNITSRHSVYEFCSLWSVMTSSSDWENDFENAAAFIIYMWTKEKNDQNGFTKLTQNEKNLVNSID